jgi:very-short-patch-repair endonuclease
MRNHLDHQGKSSLRYRPFWALLLTILLSLNSPDVIASRNKGPRAPRKRNQETGGQKKQRACIDSLKFILTNYKKPQFQLRKIQTWKKKFSKEVLPSLSDLEVMFNLFFQLDRNMRITLDNLFTQKELVAWTTIFANNISKMDTKTLIRVPKVLKALSSYRDVDPVLKKAIIDELLSPNRFNSLRYNKEHFLRATETLLSYGRDIPQTWLQSFERTFVKSFLKDIDKDDIIDIYRVYAKLGRKLPKHLLHPLLEKSEELIIEFEKIDQHRVNHFITQISYFLMFLDFENSLHFLSKINVPNGEEILKGQRKNAYAYRQLSLMRSYAFYVKGVQLPFSLPNHTNRKDFTISNFQKVVNKELKGLLKTKFLIEEKVNQIDRTVDILIKNKKIIIEIDGPYHFLVNGKGDFRPHGLALFQDEILKSLGYKIFHIPFYEWQDPVKKPELIKRLLKLYRNAEGFSFIPSVFFQKHFLFT